MAVCQVMLNTGVTITKNIEVKKCSHGDGILTEKNEKNSKALPNSPCLFISTVRNTFHKSLSFWYTANSACTNQLILTLIIFIAKKNQCLGM